MLRAVSDVVVDDLHVELADLLYLDARNLLQRGDSFRASVVVFFVELARSPGVLRELLCVGRPGRPPTGHAHLLQLGLNLFVLVICICRLRTVRSLQRRLMAYLHVSPVKPLLIVGFLVRGHVVIFLAGLEEIARSSRLPFLLVILPAQ